MLNRSVSFNAVALIATTLPSAAALAHGYKAGALSISHPWSRQTAPDQSVGGGFLVITNSGAKDDKLVAVTSPAATEVQLHTMSMDGGVMRMRQVTDGLTVPAHGKLGAEGNKFSIVFVSVDPGHDKPEAVGEYVKLFGTPIIGLTGSEEQLAPVEKAYGVYVAKVPQPGGDYTIDHSSAVLLMDGQGRNADIISHDEPEAAALAKLKALVG